MILSELYNIILKYPVITTDSRNVPPKSIFWALRGENFNGNKFVQAALESGASYAVIDDKKYTVPGKTFLYKDTLKTLQSLANFHRKKLNIPILALTGTNGKTTTKELINSVLATQYNVKATQGNLNNHIGVPLTILSFDKSTEIGIIEMGANHPGEINELCKIAEPNFGLITNIGKAHLEGFGSFEGVIKTKEELYKNIIKNKGTIFYNSGNKILYSLYKGDKTVAYGKKQDDFLTGKILSSEKYLNIEIETYEGLKTEINSKLIGFYNFENILAAACIGSLFNISIQNIKKAVETYIPDNNRSQYICTKQNEIILDAYNANPTSMKASIQNFLTLKKENKIIIVGDMYELGKYSKQEHYNILKTLSEALKSNKIIETVIIGNFFKEAFYPDFKNSKLIHFTKREEAETYIKKNTYNNCTFMIKGSRGMKLENLTKYIR